MVVYRIVHRFGSRVRVRYSNRMVDDKMKKTYDVCVPFTGTIWVTVEADSPEEAINEAFNSEQLNLDNVHEWQAHVEICSGNMLHASQNEAYAVESLND